MGVAVPLVAVDAALGYLHVYGVTAELLLLLPPVWIWQRGFALVRDAEFQLVSAFAADVISIRFLTELALVDYHLRRRLVSRPGPAIQLLVDDQIPMPPPTAVTVLVADPAAGEPDPMSP